MSSYRFRPALDPTKQPLMSDDMQHQRSKPVKWVARAHQHSRFQNCWLDIAAYILDRSSQLNQRTVVFTHMHNTRTFSGKIVAAAINTECNAHVFARFEVRSTEQWTYSLCSSVGMQSPVPSLYLCILCLAMQAHLLAEQKALLMCGLHWGVTLQYLSSPDTVETDSGSHLTIPVQSRRCGNEQRQVPTLHCITSYIPSFTLWCLSEKRII